LKNNNVLYSYLKISLAMMIVGSSVVVGKLIISSFPVFLASELRFIVASIILIPLLLLKEKKVKLHSKDLFLLFLQALTGVFLFNVFMLYGLKYTTAIEAGIITSTLPAIVGILSFLFLKERLTIRRTIGILFAVFGLVLINIIGGKPDSISLFGNLMIIGAVVGEALFMIIGKAVSSRLSPLLISTLMSVFGLIMFLPFSVYEALHFDFSALTALDWGYILYFGVVVTVIAFILMYQGLSKVSASSAGVFTSVLPISTLILSFFLLNEDILPIHIVGVLFVLVAIYFITKEETTSKGEIKLPDIKEKIT
jgi:drug/metabolite transporter (DMT)-like permease